MPFPMLNIAQPGYQRPAINALQQQAFGQGGPTAADEEARRRSQEVFAQMLGMARSGRGNQALQMRNAMGAGADAQAQIADSAMAANAQQRQAALAQLLAQSRADQAQNNLLSGGFANALSGAAGQAATGNYLGAGAGLAPLLLGMR